MFQFISILVTNIGYMKFNIASPGNKESSRAEDNKGKIQI